MDKHETDKTTSGLAVDSVSLGYRILEVGEEKSNFQPHLEFLADGEWVPSGTIFGRVWRGFEGMYRVPILYYTTYSGERVIVGSEGANIQYSDVLEYREDGSVLKVKGSDDIHF